MAVLAIVLGGLLLITVVVLSIFLSRRFNSPSSDPALLLKADMTELSKSVNELKEGLQKQLSDQLMANSKHMASQYAASSKIIAEVTKNLTELKESNKQVINITDELKTLQNVLQNPKQRGVLGEYLLAQVLENVLPPDRFKLQHRFKDGEIV